MLTWREEVPESPASRALWDEYLSLVGERVGQRFEGPSERIFGTTEAFVEWIVGYDEDGEALACGGLAVRGGRLELKRMFVRARARGRGLGRELLSELERRAAARGAPELVLFTTDVLREAVAMYGRAGYEVERTGEVDGRTELWMVKRLDARPLKL